MINHLEKMLFTRELSVLLHSGVPLGETLESLRDKTKEGKLQTLIVTLLADVENGQSFSHALERFPKVFDPLYINLVKLGEASGTLRENLDFLTRELEGSYALKKKIQGIMLYPMIVLSMALLLGILMSIFILPRLIKLFDSFDVALPLSTRILLSMANFMQHYGVIFFISVFFFLFLSRFIVSLSFVKPYWHRILLSFPLLGGLFRDVTLAHFCRDMGIMLQSGLSIVDAFSVEEKVITNRAFASLVKELSQTIATGQTISVTLSRSQHKKDFPPLAIKMISAGERTGKLSETFFYLENFFTQEADRKIKNMTVLFEPILLIFIGLIVTFLAVAILTPIYSLTGSVRR